MIHLRLRTEYSFGYAFGQTSKIIAALGSAPAAAITDGNSWGHVDFFTSMKAAGKKALLGCEIATVETLATEERQRMDRTAFIARSDAGLREIYALLSEASENFHYVPRITFKRLAAVGKDVIILTDPNPQFELLPKKTKNLFMFVSPTSARSVPGAAKGAGKPIIAGVDNLFPRPEDRVPYEIIANNPDMSLSPRHIMTEDELRLALPDLPDEAFSLSERLAGECSVSLPSAEMVKYPAKKTLRQLCVEAAPKRGVNLKNPVYGARLDRELTMIADKKFEDYFYVIWDLIQYAKKHMMVGPARGSSCGSLVCYLLSITEIDPIPFGLLFERFIDVTRYDLPDIDIDFADDRRDMVFEYLSKKYGGDCVVRLGTVNRFKAKSALAVAAKALKIGQWELADLRNSMIERSSGDSRAGFCILDTFNFTEVGRSTLKKFPGLAVAAELEAHSNHTGQHAAGVVVTAKPTRLYCAIDAKKGVAQVDKVDAEKLNLLKIDALGLRTLSIIQDCLTSIGKSREWLMGYRLDDAKAFDVLNASHFAGVFQFEGLALQSLCKQMKVDQFNDIVALTALARPGPLASGGASDYLARRTGKAAVEYLHKTVEPMTKVTYGVVIYQEQVMQIVRNVGDLSWEDTSTLRKAMSKSFGKEYFDQFWERFKVGAKKNGLAESQARHVWDHVNTMGAWSFNQSHAVAYGMVSYWCLVLKAHHPLEWAAACLRNPHDDDQMINLLRELKNEGHDYVAFDREKSQINWTIQDGKLYGGLLGIKGVGEKKAAALFEKRKTGKKFTEKEEELLSKPVLIYEDVFQCRTLWGHIKEEPTKYNIVSPMRDIGTFDEAAAGTFAVIGQLIEKNPRDLNEPIFLAKRGGQRIEKQNLFLNMMLRDDTGTINATINRYQYDQLAVPLLELAKDGDWLLVRCHVKPGFRKLYIDALKLAVGKEFFSLAAVAEMKKQKNQQKEELTAS